jgi:hypothetical protein
MPGLTLTAGAPVTSDTTLGVQAIDEGLFDGALGKTAALGFNRPNSAFTTIARTIGLRSRHRRQSPH